MLRKTLVVLAVALVFGAAFASPALAQSQTVTFNIGGFNVRGAGSRVAGDVLVAELNAGYYDALAFKVSDFNSVTFGGDWTVALTDYIDAGVGVNYFSGTAPSVSANFVNENGSEITQDLNLRIVPITASVRFLPIGRHAAFEPYIGAGIGFFKWRYRETGQFVNPTDASIFGATYEDSGWATGPVIIGGARFPIGQFVVGGEVRYQWANADLSTDFLGPKIDLGGLTYQATFGVRF
jgi:outer membrane protein W